MLAGYDIVCFSPNPWQALWRNRHQIMSRLARQNRVLFVEPAPYLRRVLADLSRRGPAAVASPSLVSPLPNLWVYRAPGYAAVSGRPPLADLTFALRRRHLRQTLRRLGFDRPLLWVFQYNVGEMVGHLDERLRIYHAVDEYAAYELDFPPAQEEARRAHIRALEADLIARMDLVFVASEALYESKRPLHPHVVLVPNGADYEHFARPGRPPATMASLPRPRLVFAGAINEKIDLALLAEVAARRPDWQVVLIGPVTLRRPAPALVRLQGLTNVHFLGEQPPTDLPAFLHAGDVCLMPYVRNEWTRNISPLKLYEYLATGLPIVATPIPAVAPFADLVFVAADPEGTMAAIVQALADDSPERRRRQQEVARQHTWDNRLERMSAAIMERLNVGTFTSYQ
ncbi:MAG: glycosyltransferase [Caldilineales bacterium]|nr:glycosyltransferase [Caldilineales bacterium]